MVLIYFDSKIILISMNSIELFLRFFQLKKLKFNTNFPICFLETHHLHIEE